MTDKRQKSTYISPTLDPKFAGKDKTQNITYKLPGEPTPVLTDRPGPTKKTPPIDETSQIYLRYMLEKGIEVSREDANSFMEFCMVDDKGRPIVQASMHEAWQELFRTTQYLNLWSFTEGGKSTQLAGYLLHRLGKNPHETIIFVSKNEAPAKKVASLMQRYIQSTSDEVGRRFHLVFPHLRPGTAKQDQWNALNFTVHRTNPYIKDPTFQGFGLGSNPTSTRATIAVLDDLLTVDSVASPKERDATWDFIQNKVISRMMENCQIIVSGTPYHHDDVLHRLEQRKDIWKTVKYPVINRRTWDEASLAWPEVWPLQRIIKERKNVLSSSDFAKQMLCEAKDDSDALFQDEDIRSALRAGFSYNLVHHVAPVEMGPGAYIYTGIDLGIKKGVGRDFTAMFTMLQRADGRRQVLWLDIGQWGPKEIVSRINDLYLRYRGIIYIENNQAQDYIVQWMEGELAQAAVRPFTTGANKHHPDYGVESISVELSKGMWIIPSLIDPDEENNRFKVESGYPEIDKWIEGMTFYRRGSHVADPLMAAWICREGARYGDTTHRATVQVNTLRTLETSSSISPIILPRMFTRYTNNGG